MLIERPRGLFGRLRNLFAGRFAAWIREREHRTPAAVYEQAIAERLCQYGELKEAVAGILYLRNKLEAETRAQRDELARLQADLRRALAKGDDELALVLVGNKQTLLEALERAEGELGALSGEAEQAKENLVGFRNDIRGLEREKGRALAMLAGAQARRRMQAVLGGLSVDADVRALEGVRAHVARLAGAAHLEQELAQEGGVQARIRAIREEARQEAALSELEQLKLGLRPTAIPPPTRSGAAQVART